MPVINSINIKNAQPPSNAGKGNKLNTAKFTEINAVKYRRLQIPAFAASPLILTIVTGPPISVFRLALPENNILNPKNVCLTNETV
ncbi:hypothetical protein D3C76_1034680 [compost metagenome]